MKLWDKWVNEEEPDTFKFLELAKDGGFSEVGALYTHSRWVSSAMLIIFVLYNVYYVIELDLALSKGGPDAAADVGMDNIEDLSDKFYISNSIQDWLSSMYGFPSREPTQLLGTLELAVLGYYFLDLLYCMLMMLVDKGGSFRRWYHCTQIFWETLPLLSSYSAMKLLNCIVPTVFLTVLGEKILLINESISEGKGKVLPILGLVVWFFTVIIRFVIGFDTFLLKLRVVSVKASDSTDTMEFTTLIPDIILPVIQFLVQVLGVVQLGPFVRKRLFVFIFGGEDGVMQNEEVELMNTWNALLAKRMYREYNWWKFLAVMTSFSDEDFQSLVLNENADVKKAEIGD